MRAPKARRWADVGLRATSWGASVVFLAWAVRLVAIEGYLFPLSKDFTGDFTRTASLQAPRWFTGEGIFYGPIFVLEFRGLYHPGLLSGGDFARLDFVLFGIAFVCTWLALFGITRLRLAIVVLGLWLVHHGSVEAFSNTSHLEVLELTFLCAGLLLAVRGWDTTAGVSLGLAAATKTLPLLFLPYLALTRRWRMLLGAVLAFSALFLVVCWVQRTPPSDGLLALIYQGGNLNKVETSEFEYALRTDFARAFAADGVLTDAESNLAIGLQWLVAAICLVVGAIVLARVPLTRSTYGLGFGLIAAVMLVAAPSAHIMNFIFLLPGWTAALAVLLQRRLAPGTTVLWVALAASYTFSGFDQPFFLAQRLIGVGQIVPQHWLDWHLPALALLTCVGLLSALLLTAQRATSLTSEHGAIVDWRGGSRDALEGARG